MTKQALFNKVARHLIKQNCKAKNEYTYVCYGPYTQRRCAYGCLLPLSFYKKHGDVYTFEVRRKMELTLENTFLMNALQICHDQCQPSRWKQRLRAIARFYGLEIPEFLRNSKKASEPR